RIGDSDDAGAIAAFDDGFGIGAPALGVNVAGIDGEAIALVVPDDRTVALAHDDPILLVDDGAIAFAHLVPLLAELRNACRRWLPITANELTGVSRLRRWGDRGRGRLSCAGGCLEGGRLRPKGWRSGLRRGRLLS